MKILPGSLFLAIFAASVVSAQQTDFTISQNGKTVGSAASRITASKGGFDSESLLKVNMQGLNYQLSKTERLSAANHLLHVVASGTVNNTAVNITVKPDSAQLLMNTSANGRSTTTRLDAHKGAVFMPDFDPGALQTLLTLAVEQNNADLWAVIPKKAGSVAPVTLATLANEKGTLDGKPIVVHHLEATISGAKTEIFSGPSNQLLQAELPQQGFALVRKDFVLTPPAKPGAAPTPPPDAQQPTNQQQPAQQQPYPPQQ